MQNILRNFADQLARDELTMRDIDSVLGKDRQERGEGVEVHYQERFELLRSQGHLVAGKEPLNTFLTQINRSEAVERVGSRTGRYKVKSAA